MFRVYFESIKGATTDYYKEIDCADLLDAENMALIECRFIIGNDKVMLVHLGNMRYEVRDGLVGAGSVFIRSL